MSLEEVGQVFEKARKQQHLKIKKVSEITKIKEKYIIAMEEGTLANHSDQIYTTGYLKQYAKFLGLDPTEIIAKVNEGTPEIASKPKDLTTETSAFSYKNELALKPNKVIIIIAIIFCLAIYGIFAILQNTGSDAATAIQEKGVYVTVNIYKHPEDTKPVSPSYILMARSNVPVLVYNTEGKVFIDKTIAPGEIEFLPENQKFSIKTDKPDSIDVFINDEKNTFLGTLDTVFTFMH